MMDRLPSAKRIWSMVTARNYEFFRDYAAFGWNFAFPLLLIIGFGLMFNNREYQQFKVGVFPAESVADLARIDAIPERLRTDRNIQLLPIATQEEGEHKLGQHNIDLLLSGANRQQIYWINDTSPKGELAEKILLASVGNGRQLVTRQTISGPQVRYLDWLFPGILAMNMMFSALWGVGYVVVRYRKNGALKRLKATPLTAFEYLSAQMISRIFLLMFTLIVVFTGGDLLFDFVILGSRWLIFFLFFLGGTCLSALGLILAARGTSEEFTSGILNFITWPMMFLSEVWFSLEGSPEWVQRVATVFPLTHLLRAVRRVMNEAATLADVYFECLVLVLLTFLFLGIASAIFSWNE